MSTPSDPPEAEEPKPRESDAPKEHDAPRVSEAPRASSSEPRRGLGVIVVLLLAGVAVFALIRAPVDSRLPLQEEETAAPVRSSTAVPPPPPRCSKTLTPSHRVGRAAPTDADAGDDALAAFGAEVGRAAVIDTGFALGVRQDQGGGATSAVLLLTDFGASKLHDLGRSRGDFDAPLVAPFGKGWVAGLLEPNASGLSLRIAAGGESELKLGPELEQQHDESLAFDIAAGQKTVVVAWDDVTKDGKNARVLWLTLAPDLPKKPGKTNIASSKLVDAETPRVVTRDGGFWLAYIARKALEMPKEPDDAALGRIPKEKRDDDAEARPRHPAEKIDPSWIELVPLDESGAASGPPRPVTAAEGHVLSFDLESGAGGSALIAWRDDDTPSGAHGGRVSLMAIAASGGTQTQLVAQENVGSGVPSLLPGWIALSDAAGRAMVAPLATDGTLQGELRYEPAIGTGDVLAAKGDHLLIATAAGTAVDLTLIDCKR